MQISKSHPYSRERIPRFVLFKALIVVGVILGLLLLIQSIVDYRQVSEELVSSELQREARRHLTTIQRELNKDVGDSSLQSPSDDVARLSQLFEGLREQEPNRFAWIRLVNGLRANLVNVGSDSKTPFTAEQFRVAYDRGAPVTSELATANGRVVVFLFAVRLTRRPLAEGSLREPEVGSGPRAGARFVEMALYWESASQEFNRLRRDLIISFAAAVGLLIAVALIWFRFPNYLHGVQLEQQTELARRVQDDLLPSANVTFESLDLAAICEPAWEVGGDFYDVFAAGNGRIALVVGDVSGKGVPASMVMGLILGAVRNSNWTDGSKEHEESTVRLSEFLRTHATESRFASMFWCCYDPAEKVLHYVNAGHPPPIVVRSSVASEGPQNSPQVLTLGDGGPVLGIVPNPVYRQCEVPLAPGDLLILYSDGIVEATDASEKEYGEERLLATVLNHSSKPSAEIRDAVLRNVQEFLGKHSAQDDLTLVIARIKQV